MDIGPPRFEVPGYLDRSIVLVRNDRLAVSLEAIACYSTGFAATIHVVGRSEGDDQFIDVSEFTVGLPHARRGDHLLFGAEFPGATVVVTGGSGDEFGWKEEVWVEPLPRTGTVDLACAWPAEGVAETRVELEAAPFVEAAARTRVLWRDG